MKECSGDENINMAKLVKIEAEGIQDYGEKTLKMEKA